jgi:hypothetical protein
MKYAVEIGSGAMIYVHTKFQIIPGTETLTGRIYPSH